MSNNGVPTDQAFKGHDRVLSIKEDNNRYNASKKNHYRLQIRERCHEGRPTYVLTSVPPCKLERAPTGNIAVFSLV